MYVFATVDDAAHARGTMRLGANVGRISSLICLVVAVALGGAAAGCDTGVQTRTTSSAVTTSLPPTTAAPTTSTIAPPPTSATALPDSSAADAEIRQYVAEFVPWFEANQALHASNVPDDLSELTADDIQKAAQFVAMLHESIDQLRAMKYPEAAAAVHQKVVSAFDGAVMIVEKAFSALRNRDQAALDAVLAEEDAYTSTTLMDALNEWYSVLGEFVPTQ
jgi:hypothetical protein